MKTSGSISYHVQQKKLPDCVFGVSQKRSGDIRSKLSAKGIEVISATRVGNLTYLEFKTDKDHDRAVKWIYRWYEHEFTDTHWQTDV